MNVSITKIASSYPSNPPFNPSDSYPEYPVDKISRIENQVYGAVRNNLFLLGYDKNNYGTAKWNPLGNIISPGNVVFVKPNFVDHKHRFNEEVWTVITHPSVIRAVCDYVAIALGGNGKIIIGDNPHVDTDFNIVKEICSLDNLKEFYENNFHIECEIVDLRHWHMPDLKYYGFKEGRVSISGDPIGKSTINVKNDSIFSEVNPLLFRGTYTDRIETIKHHILGNHKYIFSNSILKSDVYVSIPKLKSHSKVGITCNIKGLIGTIAEKNCLVHWRINYPLFGGDEYPGPEKIRDYYKLTFQHILTDFIPEKIYFRLRNFLNKTFIGKKYNKLISTDSQRQRMLRGAWEGNDTTWRMAVDVYNAFVMDIAKFRLEKGWCFKGFSVVDGIMGGDTDGPHFPNATLPKTIISGEDLLAVDLVSARLMDYDISKIKYLNHLIKYYDIDLNKISISSDSLDVTNYFNKEKSYLLYKPPHFWPNLSLKNLNPGKSYLPLYLRKEKKVT